MASIHKFALLLLAVVVFTACSETQNQNQAQAQEDKIMVTPGQMPPLSDAEKRVIEQKGTDAPFSGKYVNYKEKGTYVCRKCGAALYKSERKFDSNCGWPAFDDEIEGAVNRSIDADGMRTEITCAKCGAHLGHVFTGEGFTDTNTRHCVNSTSLVFKPDKMPDKLERAIFAGGCFWGLEELFRKLPGVEKITVGYTGGTTENPTYQQVCTGDTGHCEALEIVFDPKKISYEELAKKFFEYHDPTQKDKQGPDVGSQYRSALFYFSDQQKKTAEKLIDKLIANGYDVVTEVSPATKFYPAEDYHQDYLQKNPGGYMCHSPINRFEIPADQAPKH